MTVFVLNITVFVLNMTGFVLDMKKKFSRTDLFVGKVWSKTTV